MPVNLYGKYDTPLTPSEKLVFTKQYAKSLRDMEDYDIQGEFLAGRQPKPGMHGSDTFKKPNHPTFSAESQYSNSFTPGGHWVDPEKEGGRGRYIPSPNMFRDQKRMKALIKYLKGPAERDQVSMLPPTIARPGLGVHEDE